MNKSRNGFTLIELLIVIAIVGILAALLLPNLMSAQSRAFDVAAAGCAKQIASAQAVVLIDDEEHAGDLAALNAATSDMAGNCEAEWVDDTSDFQDGWNVSHPNGSGLVYSVGPNGIIPPP